MISLTDFPRFLKQLFIVMLYIRNYLSDKTDNIPNYIIDYGFNLSGAFDVVFKYVNHKYLVRFYIGSNEFNLIDIYCVDYDYFIKLNGEENKPIIRVHNCGIPYASEEQLNKKAIQMVNNVYSAEYYRHNRNIVLNMIKGL